MALLALGILIDSDYLRVGQEFFGFGGHGSQVVSCEQGRGQDRPMPHVRTLFLAFHAAFANLQHVWIVPVSGSGKFLQAILAESNHRHAVVVIRDVSRGAPEISGSRTPAPRSFHAPVANAEYDWAS